MYTSGLDNLLLKNNLNEFCSFDHKFLTTTTSLQIPAEFSWDTKHQGRDILLAVIQDTENILNLIYCETFYI